MLILAQLSVNGLFFVRTYVGLVFCFPLQHAAVSLCLILALVLFAGLFAYDQI